MVTAITRAQLMLIAARGRREYTKAELEQIFDRGYIEFFAALERVHQVAHNAEYSAKLAKHINKPHVNPVPKRFRSNRYVRTDFYHILADL